MNIRNASMIGATTMLLALAAIPAAHAADSSVAPSVVLHYDAASAATDDGAHALYRRIVAAASQVCPNEVSNDLQRAAMARRCNQSAIDRAVAQVREQRVVELAGRAHHG